LITHLDRLDPPPEEPAGSGGPDHPMRTVTRQVAFEPTGWTADRRARVADLFSELAPEWSTRIRPGRHDALLDALARGFDGFDAAGTMCVEVGSGTGDSTAILGRWLGPDARLVAFDIALPMLALAEPGVAPRVQADASCLPLRDGSADLVVLVNMLLFPVEMDRILRREGRLLWVNTSGDRTPIHLPAEDVAAALPGSWSGVGSAAGQGTWCVLRRT
jgi:SAM-dependent methyltransferase